MRVCNIKWTTLGPAMAIAVATLAGPVDARMRILGAATQPSAGAGPTSAPATQPSATGQPALPWLTRFADAIDEARRSHKPILVDVGAEWCVWCRQLDQQIATDPVQQRLGNFTRLRLDADRDTDSIHNLAVGPLPALRLLSPGGQVVAWHNGYMKADELAAWLDAHAKRAEAPPLAELEAAGPPDAAALDAILARLTDRDPVVHQAAVRRLTPYPEQSAQKVVAAFADGKLRQRLAVWELLAAWRAPLGGLDPWKPESVTDASLGRLKQWAGEKHQAPVAAAELSAEDLGIARHDIAAMLQTTDPAEVESARERLSRFGPSLLPEVYAALKTAGTDRDRERLTALRYRCVSGDARALHWPEGFDRLASVDPQVRHAAVDELGKDATAGDAPLLMELFSDPDRFVRENSLRLLQSVGGEEIPGGLVRLLHDPEPNVRAAVLKQLTETPDPLMVPEVVKFVGSEKDTDLIVHAIRFLREAKGPAAKKCLQSLLGSESWRVRAEAAEGLGAFVERYGSNDAATQADVYAAMIKLLDDPDGFVVSRALAVLKDAQVPSAISAIAKVADRRPELAPEVVKALSGQSSDPAAQAALRRFCAHHDAGVRAVAMTALGSNATAAEIGPGLRDSSARMRIATARIVEELLVQGRPDRTNQNADAPIDWEKYLAAFRGGKGQPAWAADTVAPLRKMLASDDAEEQLSAAVPLIALGDDGAGMDVLRQTLVKRPEKAKTVAEALQWLPWEKRIALFNDIRKSADADAPVLGVLANNLSTVPDDKAAGALWDLLGAKGADISVASQIERSLMHVYTGSDYWQYRRDAGDSSKQKPMIDMARKMAAEGSANQRVVAMALLLTVSPDDASAAAGEIIDKNQGGEGLMTAALQIRLLSQSRPDGVKTALAQLGGSTALRKVALGYLAAGAEPIRNIGGEMYLMFTNPQLEFRTFSETSPTVIEPPPGITVAMLDPLLSDPDPENGAYAGYLLCVLGERKGLDGVVQWWRGHRDDETWRRLAYRAVSVVNDDSFTPVLAEIYSTYDKTRGYDIRDFYWTIRVMKGDQVLKLRKRIRDEVGMDNLR